MKIIAFFIMVMFVHVQATTYGQKVSLNFKNASLSEVLDEIQKQTGYDFLYNSALIDQKKTITIKTQETELKQVLTNILSSRNLSFEVDKNSVLIKRSKIKRSKTPAHLIEVRGSDLENQRKIITGLVTDSIGSPLYGVSVFVKGAPTTGTSTDQNGRFIIEIPSKGTTLIFSLVGYLTYEISAEDKNELNVILKNDVSGLEEVVVVAFGTQKKTTMVGSVTTVNPKELKGPTSNLTTMLAGRVAGMIAYQRSGEPGRDNAEFFIRGVTSFGAGKQDPLILIDGMESTSNDLARIQPDDIAGFSVLKDATAAALYGARGANGILLITTKSGTEGATRFNARFENSISTNTRNFEFADNITYMNMANEASMTRDPLGGLVYNQSKIENTLRGGDPLLYPNNNWINQLIKDYTYNQRFNINMEGGGGKARFYIAGTYNVDNGLLKTTKLNNFNNNIEVKNYELRSNVNIKLTNSTEAVVRTSGRFDSYNGPVGGGRSIFQQTVWSNPVRFPALYPAEFNLSAQHPLFGNTRRSGLDLYSNPLAKSVSGYQEDNTSNVTVQLEMKQDLDFFIPGLSARLMAYTRRKSFFDLKRQYQPFYYEPILDSQGGITGLQLLNEDSAEEWLSFSPGSRVVDTYTYTEAAANYNRSFKEKHEVSGMLISIFSNFLTPNVGDLQSSLPRRNLGLSGRFTYSFDQRYLAEMNFGYNGSERFAKNNRYGFFPSLGLAWVISNEPFFKKMNQSVTNLKLRGTYGLLGNDQIGNINDRFFYLSNVNLKDANYGYTFGERFDESGVGVSIDRYENRDITWELAKKANLAMELGLFNSLNIELDLYKEHRTHILMNREYISSTMGLSSVVQANVGEAKGKGVDLSVDYNKHINNSMWITARGNFTYAANEILVNEEPNYPDNIRHQSRIGRPIQQVYGLIAERLFVDDFEVANNPLQNYGEYSAGDIKYRDVNGDGQITNLDVVPIGYPTMPEIIYGFGFTVGYKAFDVSAFFQGSARSSFWINPRDIAPFVNENGLLKVIADDYWSEDNRNSYAFYPRLAPQQMDNNTRTSTWWMRNGAFLRLKQAEVGYNIPNRVLERMKLSQLRIYANSANLFTLSSFKLWDIEMGGSGLGYPPQLAVNIGLLLGF